MISEHGLWCSVCQVWTSHYAADHAQSERVTSGANPESQPRDIGPEDSAP